MDKLQACLAELKSSVDHPRARLEHYLSLGKKVVGCFSVYTPEELVHAAGMIPLGIWGGQTELKLAKSYLPAFACPIMQSALELGLRGSYEGLSAVIIPTLCDTFRCITQNWKEGVSSIPMIAITYPQNRTFSGSVDFLMSEYTHVAEQLEAYTGLSYTPESLTRTIEIYNEHNAAMREFASVANEHLDIITPAVRHTVMKSGLFYEKEEHTAIVKEIVTCLRALPIYDFQGKKVLLTGITAEPEAFLDLLSENGMAVVGDDLAQESRQYRTDTPVVGGAPLHRLALQWNARFACCLAHEDDKQRGELLLGMCQQTGATGVVACMMKFCDPEEYDFPIYERALKKAGIATLLVEIDQQSASHEQARTRLQTFADMI